MKTFLSGLACGCLLFISGIAMADVLTFEDVPGSESGAYSAIPASYHGLAWDNFWVMHRNYAPGSGFENGIVSGDYVAYNGYTSPCSLNGSPFTFVGAYFTASLYENTSLTITGYSHDAIVDSETITIGPSSPIWFGPQWTGIDKLSFDSPGNWFVMDNFTYSVPVPAALLLFGSGIMGLLGIRRRLSPE